MRMNGTLTGYFSNFKLLAFMQKQKSVHLAFQSNNTYLEYLGQVVHKVTLKTNPKKIWSNLGVAIAYYP